MIKITIEYNQTTHFLVVDGNETVLTLRYLISELLNLSIEKLILKQENGSILVNDSQKIIDIYNKETNTCFISVMNKDSLIQQPKENNAKNFMDPSNLKNMDLSAMKPLLKDKNFMKSMFESNPAFQKMMENNPEMKQAYNSGHLRDEFQKMVDDPEYMKEQLKSADLAMKKIKNMPGGMATLNSYMKDMKNPLTEDLKPKNKLKTEKNDDNFKYYGIKNMPFDGNGNPNIFDYILQIKFLEEKGFKNFEKNMDCLEAANGDVYAVLKLYEKEKK